MGKQKFTEAEKKLIVLEVIKGKKSVLQIAKEKGISDAMIYKWRDQVLKAIDKAFSEKGRKSEEDFTAERERYLKIIGEQACVIDTLKKISEMVSR